MPTTEIRSMNVQEIEKRSLVLTGIITLAVLGAFGKIAQFASGEEVPPIQSVSLKSR